jgi:radical SAM protein with 4Fe4S-binding SPASM domain
MEEKKNVSPPRWITLQLLEKCNLRCKMCYEWGETGAYKNNHEQAVLSFEVIKEIIEDCSLFKPHYDFFGGEPLLHPNIWDIISLIKTSGSTFQIPTNGTLIKKNAELIVMNQPDLLWISLDGPEQINDQQRGIGVYKKVLEGIDELHYLRKQKIEDTSKVALALIITPTNYKHLSELFLSQLDISKVDIIFMQFQTFLSEERYIQYKTLLKNNYNVDDAPIAKGFVQDINSFINMNFGILHDQIQSIKEHCRKKNVEFICLPQNTDIKSIREYFSGNWEKIYDYHKHCIFPYFNIEVSARGDVSLCHAFYDYTFGNVYKKKILDIWESDKVNAFRSSVRKKLLPICPACCNYYHKTNNV